MPVKSESIVLNLSNYDAAPKIWNVGGKDLGIPTVRPQLILLNENNQQVIENLPPISIGYLDESYIPPVYINYLDENLQNTSLENDIEKFNNNLGASPFRVNKIKLYTNNVYQLAEQYIYYKQNSFGSYEKTMLNIIQHFDPFNPKPKIEIGKEYIGEFVLDSSKRLEVNVLPNTILIIELIYEYGEDDTAIKPSPIENKMNNAEDLNNDEEIIDLRAYVKAYYKYAKLSGIATKIPAIFSLAQSALETGYGTAKPGHAMFGIKATPSWKGATQLLTTHECVKTEDKLIETIKGPNKQCGSKTAYKVKAFFRAYKTPEESFRDHAKVLKIDRYKQAFKHTSNPEQFAKEIAKGGYAPDSGYADKVIKVMNSLKPYINEHEAINTATKPIVRNKTILIAVGATVLISVIIIFLNKKGLLRSLF